MVPIQAAYLKLDPGSYFFISWDRKQSNNGIHLSYLFQKIDDDIYFNISCETMFKIKDLDNITLELYAPLNEEEIVKHENETYNYQVYDISRLVFRRYRKDANVNSNDSV